MKLRGEPLRADDNPEILKQRLAAYGAQTAPLVTYYKGQGALRTVDGMAAISDVSAAINRALAEAAFRPVEKSGSASSRKAAPARKAAPRKAAGSTSKKAPTKAKTGSRPAKSAAKSARRKPAAKAAPKRAPGRAAKLSKKSRKAARGRRLTK
jgi:adenylate kinase